MTKEKGIEKKVTEIIRKAELDNPNNFYNTNPYEMTRICVREALAEQQKEIKTCKDILEESHLRELEQQKEIDKLKKEVFTFKELKAIYGVISSFNDKDFQQKIYYKIEEKLKSKLKRSND